MSEDEKLKKEKDPKEISQKVIDHLFKKKVLTMPQSVEVRQEIIKAISAVWSDQWCLRRQLMQYPLRKRLQLASAPEKTKVDWYVMNLYTSQEKGQKLSIKEVQTLVKHYYGFVLSSAKIKLLRQLVYNTRRGGDHADI